MDHKKMLANFQSTNCFQQKIKNKNTQTKVESVLCWVVDLSAEACPRTLSHIVQNKHSHADDTTARFG